MLRSVVIAGVVLASGVAALPAHASDDVDPTADTSAVVTAGDTDPLHGIDGVTMLDEFGVTEEVAASVDLAPDALIDELLTDDTMFVTAAGGVGFADVVDPDESAAAQVAAALESRPTRPAGLDPFTLESKPGTSKVIYLDFDGHVTPVGMWTTQTNGEEEEPLESDPFDRDGDPTAFSESERDDIYEIWHRVSEDYAPFDVNVTTKDPGVEGLRKTSPGDAAYGTRVVISPTRFAPWGGSGTIGVAYVNVFDAAQDYPAFVFTSVPQYNTPQVIGEAAAHEAGHTLGLRHDAWGTSDYYGGHNSWAPIMGLSISRPVTQWSKGEYPGATNLEDDVAIIAAKVGTRADDVGNTLAAARPMTVSSQFDGVIGIRDVDVFVVDSPESGFTIDLRPIAEWANLLAYVDVVDANGSPITCAAPTSPSGWTATAPVPMPAGRYYVIVRPMGWQTVASGFSAYGSMGQYRLTLTEGAPAGSLESCTSGITTVTPNRILDTRRGLGGSWRLGAGQVATVQVTGTAGVPLEARAAIVNVTAVEPSGWGFVTVYPCSGSVPDTSNVNYVAGQHVANSTIAALSPDGKLCVWTYAATDVLVDVTGWVGPGGESRFTPVGPDRVVDTRRGLGAQRIAAGDTAVVDLSGAVPAGASAVSFNLTASGARGGGFLTAYPCGQPRPDTSTVNYRAVEARPNNVIVRLGAGAQVCVYSYAEADVIIDVTGYFALTGLGYIPTSPTRLADTRQGRVQPPRPAGTVLSYAVGAPPAATVESAFVNITAVDHPRAGFVTAYDCAAIPDTSTVNQIPGEANANGANVRVPTCAWLSDAGHLIVDLNGWWVH